MEMVERVGRALAAQDGYAYDPEPYDARARAAIEAMKEPTEAQWGGLARALVMWWGMSQIPTGSSLYNHLKRTGEDVPDWLVLEIPDIDHVPPKGTVAACIWHAMIDAILSPKGD